MHATQRNTEKHLLPWLLIAIDCFLCLSSPPPIFSPHNKGLSSLAKCLVVGKCGSSLQPKTVHNKQQDTAYTTGFFLLFFNKAMLYGEVLCFFSSANCNSFGWLSRLLTCIIRKKCSCYKLRNSELTRKHIFGSTCKVLERGK